MDGREGSCTTLCWYTNRLFFLWYDSSTTAPGAEHPVTTTAVTLLCLVMRTSTMYATPSPLVGRWLVYLPHLLNGGSGHLLKAIAATVIPSPRRPPLRLPHVVIHVALAGREAFWVPLHVPIVPMLLVLLLLFLVGGRRRKT